MVIAAHSKKRHIWIIHVKNQGFANAVFAALSGNPLQKFSYGAFIIHGRSRRSSFGVERVKPGDKHQIKVCVKVCMIPKIINGKLNDDLWNQTYLYTNF